MPPRKRTRKAEAQLPSKKLRPSPDENSYAEAESSESHSPQSPRTPSVTESLDPALFDEEEGEFEPVQTEAGAVNTEKLRSPQKSFGGGGYNALKSFNGQVYSGMAVGGSHTWKYDEGTWKETKEEPDLWKVDYQTTKRRARKAPKGSGAPVGAEYHWLIVAHQVHPYTLAGQYLRAHGKLTAI